MLLLFFFLIAEGPDAVKFIVNHATVQAIFCVAETLNSVSPSICCLIFLFFLLDDSEIKKEDLLPLAKWSLFWCLFACFPGWAIAGACSYLAACLRCQVYAWWWYEKTLFFGCWLRLQLPNYFSLLYQYLVLLMYQVGCWRVEWVFAFASPIRRSESCIVFGVTESGNCTLFSVVIFSGNCSAIFVLWR